MATQILNTQIQIKRGTAEALERVNPILAAGEPGWAIDKNIFKIGDGATRWNDLPETGGNQNAIGMTTLNGGEIFNDYENNTAGERAHAEGNDTEASGKFSHAEGSSTVASNDQSHAEGQNSVASGPQSHAEGGETLASHPCAHAEGHGSIAMNEAAHAEGHYSTAAGYASHAEGNYTFANGLGQHVQGRYNIKDLDEKYAHIVGGGDSRTPRNIHTLDWNGNANFSGDLYVNATNPDATGGDIVATQKYVNELFTVGKDKNWYYRKWKNGIVECWKTINQTIASTDWTKGKGGSFGFTVLGQTIGIQSSALTKDIQLDFPSSEIFTFVERPTEIVTISNNTSWRPLTLIGRNKKEVVTLGTTKLYNIITNEPENETNGLDVTLDFYVIGRWK